MLRLWESSSIYKPETLYVGKWGEGEAGTEACGKTLMGSY